MCRVSRLCRVSFVCGGVCCVRAVCVMFCRVSFDVCGVRCVECAARTHVCVRASEYAVCVCV